MGILSTEQAVKIKVQTMALDLMEKQKPSKRIYIRPRKLEKVFTKIKVYNPDRMVYCKVCFKKIAVGGAIEVIGGSEQGHKNFWMCREHM